jgi:hypothetical protein
MNAQTIQSASTPPLLGYGRQRDLWGPGRSALLLVLLQFPWLFSGYLIDLASSHFGIRYNRFTEALRVSVIFLPTIAATLLAAQSFRRGRKSIPDLISAVLALIGVAIWCFFLILISYDT